MSLETPPPPSTLTAQERESVRAALRFLRTRLGGRDALARALRYHPRYLGSVKIGPVLAVRLAGVAGVPVDDLIAGRFPLQGACPHCGHVASSAATG